MGTLNPQAVLLVDDDVDTIEMYALGLSLAGYHLLTATDAESATRLTKSAHPHAVVTDLQLGGIGGWSLIRELKSDPATQAIPIVMLTGHIDVSARAREAGCAAVLTKPCLPEELAEVLDRVLRNRSTVA